MREAQAETRAAMTRWKPDAVYIERGEDQSALARRVRARLPEVSVHVIDDIRTAEPATFDEGKRRLIVQRHRGTFLQHCPAGTTGMVCCNYLVMNFGANCPFDCSYCFLQDYLKNNPALKAVTNVSDALGRSMRSSARTRSARFASAPANWRTAWRSTTSPTSRASSCRSLRSMQTRGSS